MSVILILTHAKDDCAEMVISHIRERKVDFVRFNTEEFQKTIKFSMNLDSFGEISGFYHFPNRDLNFKEIGIVWNRRIHEPEVGDELDNEPDLKEWMGEESLWGMNISFSLINAPIVNPWEINERLKFNKWIQMKRATEFGFEVPLSCLTNDLETIKDFWLKADRDVIFKKIKKGFFQMRDGSTLLVHTNKIPKDRFNTELLQRMRFCPMFLQRHIPKKYDIRSIVIGNEVFSIAIHSQTVPEGVVDYRSAAVLGKLNEMKHEQIDLGERINSSLVAYTKSFGLTFGAIDLVQTPDDRLVFLEDNPNGQWAWLEQKTKAPIAKAFADYLIRQNNNT